MILKIGEMFAKWKGTIKTDEKLSKKTKNIT